MLQSTLWRATGGIGPAPTESASFEPTLAPEFLTAQQSTDANAALTNSLCTAGDALQVIGGLLDNVQSVLTAAGSADPRSSDLPLEQSRIDSAVTTIDAIAGSTQFAGKPLLDGTFKAETSAGQLAVPSFFTASLGSAEGSSPADAEPLSTLTTGQVNDLASGNWVRAGRIVSEALGQVATTLNQISVHQNALISPEGAESINDAMDLSATELLSSPLAVYATANAPAKTVLALLGSR